jgi:hypothetical protein
MTHQPPMWLSDQAQAVFNGRIYVPGYFGLHLFGHMHENNYLNIGFGASEPRKYWQSCSLFGLEIWGEEKNIERRYGYSAGVFQKTANSICFRVWPRIAVHHKANYWHITRDTLFSLEIDGGTKQEFISKKLEACKPTSLNKKGDIDSNDAGLTKSSKDSYKSSTDKINLILPGGAMDINSKFYICRETDNKIFSEINFDRAIVHLLGPKQSGKTSLILRLLSRIKKESIELQSVYINFDSFQESQFYSLDSIWQQITIRITNTIRKNQWNKKDWDTDVEYDHNFSNFLENVIFSVNEKPLLICFDSIDRIFQFPIKSDFFSGIRAFYNSGANDDIWKKVRWLLITSSEPTFFLKRKNESPFNIRSPVRLGSFKTDQIKELSSRHGLNLTSETITSIKNYVGGHPYLVHLLLFNLSMEQRPKKEPFDISFDERIFLDHLHRFLLRLKTNKRLSMEMKKIVYGGVCQDPESIYQLEAVGLVRRDKNGKVIPFCRLYQDFFKRELI